MRNSTNAFLAISGMDCPRCRIWVHNGLRAINGVIHVHIDPRLGMAKVEFAPELTTVSAIVDAVMQAENDGWHQYEVVLVDQSEYVGERL